MKNKKTGMATHSKSSFDEGEAIRLLTGNLESNRKIKTFFGENDKTPNHDGHFELLSKDSHNGQPKKKFIVQIKKIENLQPQEHGKNTGKHKYSLCTKFLHYAKNKVDENPAIYFVVDITTKNIFWIYLSDEKLMSLSYEDKGKVTYYFSQDEMLTDIENFTNMLHGIANDRNQKFVNKTPEEIAEIQDALSYLNNLFDNDFKFIKDLMFPDLWRFGVAHSKLAANEMYLGVNGEKIGCSQGGSFAIYPQRKGKLGDEIKENYAHGLLNNDNFFNYIDMTGFTTPRKYVDNAISKILKQFFDSALIIKHVPEKVVSEILRELVAGFENTLGVSIESAVEDIKVALYDVIAYIYKVLFSEQLLSEELELKKCLFQWITSPVRQFYSDWGIDPLQEIVNNNCKEAFLSFCSENKGEMQPLNQDQLAILNVLEKQYLEYFFAVERAEELKLETVDLLAYNKPVFYFNSKEDKHEAVSQVCEIWFKDLMETYLEVCNDIFRDKKYLNSGKFEYEIVKPALQNVVWKVLKYKDDGFSIIKSEVPISTLWEEIEKKGAVGCLHGAGLQGFIQNSKTLYNSFKCLLYQGISKSLELKCEGLNFDFGHHRIFE